MGRPKPLLDWFGRPLVVYQIEQLLLAGAAEVVVVVGHEAGSVTPLVEAGGGRAVLNADYRSGRAGSIRVGAAAVAPSVRALVTLNVDQPRPATVIGRVIEAHLGGAALITTPEHGGRRGHPVVFDGMLLSELGAVTEEQEGLRAVVRRHAARRQIVALDDPVIHLEFNTPDEYAAALVAAEGWNR